VRKEEKFAQKITIFEFMDEIIEAQGRRWLVARVSNHRSRDLEFPRNVAGFLSRGCSHLKALATVGSIGYFQDRDARNALIAIRHGGDALH
jgi:hypothetical protein